MTAADLLRILFFDLAFFVIGLWLGRRLEARALVLDPDRLERRRREVKRGGL